MNNPFREALLERRVTVGSWTQINDPTSAEILAVEGVDGVFIGPYDMSGSYGIPGETGSPIVRDACRRIVEACERADKSAGLHIVKPTPQATEQALEDGFTLIRLGIDTVFVQEGACAAKALASKAD